MTGTQFISNTGLRLGGGFYALGRTEISGTLFQNNRVISGSGGGLAMDFAGSLRLNDTELIGNRAALNGGGLYAASPMEINGGRFEGNHALGGDSSGDPEGGGGLFAMQPVTLTQVNFISNTAYLNGGGLMMLKGHPLRINEGRFERNVAQGQASSFQRGGGGLYVVGDVQAVGTIFVSNTAVLTDAFNNLNIGGAGYIFGAASLDQVQVLENRSYQAGGGFYVSQAVVMTDSHFTGNQATVFNGGGLLAGGAITAIGGSFTDNSTGGSGGGLSSQGDVILDGTTLWGNAATNSGGGMSVLGGVGGVTVTLNAVDFQYNEASTGSGGAASISVGIGGRSTFSDTYMAHNTAGTSGGAIRLDTATIHGGIINQNNASNGGGIAASGLLQISGTQITSNTATADGGGIHSNSDVIMQYGIVQDNRSLNGSGGGVWGNSAVIMYDTQLLSNTAALNGGGAYARLGFSTAVTRVLFSDNTAGGAGGGLFVGRRLELSRDSRFVHNSAQLGGGLAISNTSGTTEMEMVNNLFARNQAASQGAAIYLQSPRPLHIVHTTIGDTAVNGPAAIYALSSTLAITNSIVASHTTGIEVAGGGTATANHMNYFGNISNEIGLSGTNVITGDPLFVNAAADDYRLAVGSAALDNGIDAGIAADILGNPRPTGAGVDRGAYEGAHRTAALKLFIPIILVWH